MYNIVAVIACHGRLPLLELTIHRLINKNLVKHVVCVGGPLERETCESAGAIFVEHENNPLGKKWNAGFEKARTLGCDGALFVGSSDWLSDNWLSYMVPLLGEYDLIGKADFYLLDIGETRRACHWLGYTGERRNEPIGIGRVVSARILDKINWQPFNPAMNNSMDYQMLQNVDAHNGRSVMIVEDSMESLSISTNRWVNLHKFEEHWSNKLPSIKLDSNAFDVDFPESLLL